MQVSNQTNYQTMNSYQKPVELAEQAVTPPKIEDKLELSPENKLKLDYAVEDKKLEAQAEKQAAKDATRESAVNYVGMQSKKSQVEIYLSVATDNKVSLGDDDTASIIESLRDVQKQNNIVQAYATYNENKEKFPANGLLK